MSQSSSFSAQRASTSTPSTSTSTSTSTPASTSTSTTTTTTTTTTPTTSRRHTRKHRHQVNVPADTVLTFSSYNPTQTPSSSSNIHSNQNNNSNYSIQSRPREQFVQANYRFLITPCKEIPACCTFPDAQVPWSAVDLVILPRPSDSCPICLYPLRSPRVTPCGHVFDHICMLQLFSHNDHPRCPLCSHHLCTKSLRPCAFATSISPIINHSITMRLVSRKRGSMICHPHPYPSTSNDNNNNNIIPVVSKMDAPLFCRFAYSLPSFLLQLINCDENDLKLVAKDDISLTPFVNMALTDIETRRQNIKSRPIPNIITDYCSTTTTTTAVTTTNNDNNNSNHKVKSHNDKQTEKEIINELESFKFDHGNNNINYNSNSINLSPRNVITSAERRSSSFNNNNNFKSESYWYCYQDKQSGNSFLHPINHRCLTTEYKKNFETNALLEIEGKILQIDYHTMDEILRKRYKFLEHLPDGCEFTFIELDLTHILSKETLKVHKNELKDRKIARKKHEMEQEKESKRIEKVQTQQLREYYSSLGSGQIPLSQFNAVDSTDVINFPKLNEDDDNNHNTDDDNSNNGVENDGDNNNNNNNNNNSDEDVIDNQNNMGISNRDISSYSSVTSNMGLFPALGTSPQESRTPPRGVWGGASSFPPPTTSSTISRINSTDINSNITPIHSISNNRSNDNHSAAVQKVETRRNGRRSNGRSTILLSNAGSQARR